MGCGSSQVHIAVPEERQQPRQPGRVEHIQQENPPKNGISETSNINLSPPKALKASIPERQHPRSYFLFGETPTERKIVCFDTSLYQFSTVSSRVKIPEPPLKYQPIQVIYQESQELFSSHLFTKNSHPPYNFMLALWIDTKKIFLCGGVSYDFNHVSQESFVFDTSSEHSSSLRVGNNLMGSKFDKVPFMGTKRYSHMGVVHTTGLLKYVYVFGGRGVNDELLNDCERYSIVEKKWSKIQPMGIARSTGFAFVFRDRIYVCGGYSNKPKRTKKIEVYHPQKDYWQTLDVKMHRGLETGNLFSVAPNQLLFVGGNIEYGSVNSVVRVNLQQQTYIAESDMKYPRVLAKGCMTNKEIIIFGGNFQDGLEIYDIHNKQWRETQSLYSSHLKPQQINSFTFSQQTVEVQHQEVPETTKQSLSLGDQHAFLFSHDSKPFILSINLTMKTILKIAVPMALRLRSHMGVVCLAPSKYFVCGGVSEYYQKATRASYLYYAGTNRSIEQSKMICHRYKFSICVYNQNVYVFGGKQAEDQGCLSLSEMYDMQESKWIAIRDLNLARCQAQTVVQNHRIFILGGNNGARELTQIQMYNPEDNSMTLIERELGPLSNIFVGRHGDEVFIFGNHSIGKLIVQVPKFGKTTPLQVNSAKKQDDPNNNGSPVLESKTGDDEQVRLQKQTPLVQNHLSDESSSVKEEELIHSVKQQKQPHNKGNIEPLLQQIPESTADPTQMNQHKQTEPSSESQPPIQASKVSVDSPSPQVAELSLIEVRQFPQDIRGMISCSSGIFVVSDDKIFQWNGSSMTEREFCGNQLLSDIDWARMSLS